MTEQNLQDKSAPRQGRVVTPEVKESLRNASTQADIDKIQAELFPETPAAEANPALTSDKATASASQPEPKKEEPKKEAAPAQEIPKEERKVNYGALAEERQRRKNAEDRIAAL